MIAWDAKPNTAKCAMLAYAYEGSGTEATLSLLPMLREMLR